MSDVPHIDQIIEESKNWDTAMWLSKILEAHETGGDRAMFMRLEACVRVQMQVALALIEQGLLEDDPHSYRAILEGLNADVNSIIKAILENTKLSQQFPLVYGILPLMTASTLGLVTGKHEINRKADPRYIYLYFCGVFDFLAEMDMVPKKAMARCKDDYVRNNPRYRGVQADVDREFLKTLREWVAKVA